MKKLLFLLTEILIIALLFTACSGSDKKADDNAESKADIEGTETSRTDTFLTARYDMDGDGKSDTVTLRDTTLYITFAASSAVAEHSYFIEPAPDGAYDYLFTAHAEDGALIILVDETDESQIVFPFYYSGAVLTPAKWGFDYINYVQGNDTDNNDLFLIEWTSDSAFTIRCNNYSAQKSFFINLAKYKELNGSDFNSFDKTQTTKVISTTLGISADDKDKINPGGGFSIEWLITCGGSDSTNAACYVRTTFEFNAEYALYKLTDVDFYDTTELVTPQL